GGNFDEIESTVGVGLQKFRVRDAARKSQSLDELAIAFQQGIRVGEVARKGARGEYAAMMRNIERWSTIAVRLGEKHFALGNDTVNVKDGAWDKLLEEVK